METVRYAIRQTTRRSRRPCGLSVGRSVEIRSVIASPSDLPRAPPLRRGAVHAAAATGYPQGSGDNVDNWPTRAPRDGPREQQPTKFDLALTDMVEMKRTVDGRMNGDRTAVVESFIGASKAARRQIAHGTF